MRRMLVAGGTGHLGRKIVPQLKERGYWVRALARDPRKVEPIQQWVDDIFVGDFTQPITLTDSCNGIEVVMSSAGRSVSAKRQKDKASFTTVDYQGNKNLLDMAITTSVRKFIYVSVFGHELFGHLEYVRAQEDFAKALQASGPGLCHHPSHRVFPRVPGAVSPIGQPREGHSPWRWCEEDQSHSRGRPAGGLCWGDHGRKQGALGTLLALASLLGMSHKAV